MKRKFSEKSANSARSAKVPKLAAATDVSEASKPVNKSAGKAVRSDNKEEKSSNKKAAGSKKKEATKDDMSGDADYDPSEGKASKKTKGTSKKGKSKATKKARQGKKENKEKKDSKDSKDSSDKETVATTATSEEGDEGTGNNKYLMKDLKPSKDGKKRCWGEKEMGNMLPYHDNTWGRAERNSTKLFEQICLQSMQSGLNWRIVLNKTDNFRKAFKNFDFKEISTWGSAEVEKLMQDAGIVRNRLKIEAVLNNAKQVLRLEQTHAGGFSAFIWQYEPTTPEEKFVTTESLNKLKKGHMRTDFDTKPEHRTVSDAVHPTVSVAKLTAALKKEHFKFLGPTSVLSFMQACGLMNHHHPQCFVVAELAAAADTSNNNSSTSTMDT